MALATLYYGLYDGKTLVSMPLVADENDHYVLVEFKSPSTFASFKGYRRGNGFLTLTSAKRAMVRDPSKTYGIYKLLCTRPTADTLIVSNV
jgi:hypothetical protein